MGQTKHIAVCVVFALLLAAGFLLCVFGPKETYSDSERRSLAAFPKVSAYTVRTGRFMSDFETYVTDTFPFRDSFRTVKAVCSSAVFRRQDNHGIYEADGYLSAVEYPLDEKSLKRASDRFRYICEKYLTRANAVFLSVIPDKNCFLAEESGHLSMDYADFEKRMEDGCDFAEYISISDLLQREDYYKTDTHWRQERIVDVAERLLQKMGAKAEQRFQIQTLSRDFYGVYYGQSALPASPDTLSYLTGEAIDSCYVYDGQNQKEISVYDFEKAAQKDPYEIFLSGPLSLVILENPKASKEKKLVIFRDSFGSSIAPLLCGGYSKITLADIRYIHPDLLGKFVDFDACDVLFLYSTLVMNHSDTLK